jgi:pimeloyl-ACP methyl ester carboxylesterase
MITTSGFICDTARRRHVDATGVRLHLLEWGEPGRPALCFLHGGAAHAHWFDAVAPPFVDRFHTISLDQRGHGLSTWATPPAYATQDFAADLVAVMDALGWHHMVVIGHSMGGHNAMSFAAWHPERVRGLVIVDSRPALPADRLARLRRRGERPMFRHPTADTAVARFRLLPPETAAEPELLAHLARQGIVERDGGWSFRFDPACNASRQPVDAWQLLPGILAPTLIVRGELSPILPPEMAERLRSAIPQASLVEIPGAYHHLVLDQPKAFVGVLEEFLGALPGS